METITWNISIKKIFEDNRKFFVQENYELIRENSFKNIEKILNCNSQQLGFASFKCDTCSKVKHIPFTCKSRFCNSCSKPQSDIWMNNLISWRPSWLRYHHVTFTIPEELRIFFKRHRSALKILPATASSSIQYFLTTKQKINVGILAVIHTFWAQLNRNPHTHLLVSHWWFHHSWTFKKSIFLPYNAIATSWTKFLIKNLKTRVKKNISSKNIYKELQFLNTFYDYHSKLTWKKTNRYVDFWSKPRQFTQVIWYLWRYLKRPAISQSRIISYDGQSVTFSYVDKKDNVIKKISCSVHDFMWLLLQHLPNKNFRMLYYYWFFSNRCKRKYLQRIYALFPQHNISNIPSSFAERIHLFTGKNPLNCSCRWCFSLWKITIPWYPPKYFDSW